MDQSGKRMNGAKEKEQRLRRRQIELGRARLVARPLELLQQPVNIIPPSDSDPDDIPDPDLELDSEVGDSPCSELNSAENRNFDPNEITRSVSVDLLVDLDPLNTSYPSTNPFLVSDASGNIQDEMYTGTNLFTEFYNSDLSTGTSISGHAAAEDVQDAVLNPFSLISTQVSSEDAVDNSDWASHSQTSSLPSPICEENNAPSVTSGQGCARKDSGYGLTSLESLSSVTSPASVMTLDSEGSDLVGKGGSSSVADSTSNVGMGDSGVVTSMTESLLHETEMSEYSQDDKRGSQTHGSNNIISVSGEQLISFTDNQIYEVDKTKRLGNDTSLPTDFLSGKNPGDCDPDHEAQGVKGVRLSLLSLDNMDREVKLTTEDMTGEDNTYTAFSDVDSDVASGDGGLDVEEDNSDSAVSETDGDFKSNAVGLLVDVYGMNLDETCEGDLSEIPEETATELEALSSSDVSEMASAAHCGRGTAKGVLRKEPKIDTNSLENQDSLPYEDSQERRDSQEERTTGNRHSFSTGPEAYATSVDSGDQVCSQTVSDALLNADQVLCSVNSSPATTLFPSTSDCELTARDSDDKFVQGENVEGLQAPKISPNLECERVFTQRPFMDKEEMGFAWNQDSDVANQTPLATKTTMNTLLDLEPNAVSACANSDSRPLHLIDNLEFPLPQGNLSVDFGQSETDLSLLGDVSDYSLTTCYDSLDPSLDLEEERSSEIRPEIFEAFASQVINNLMDGSFSLASLPSFSVDESETPTPSLSSFEMNEMNSRSPESTQDLEETLSDTAEDTEETNFKNTETEWKRSVHGNNNTVCSQQFSKRSDSGSEDVNVMMGTLVGPQDITPSALTIESGFQENSFTEKSGDTPNSDYSNNDTLKEESKSSGDEVSYTGGNSELNLCGSARLSTERAERQADVKIGEIVTDIVAEPSGSCTRNNTFEHNIHVTLNAPIKMSVCEERESQQKAEFKPVSDQVIKESPLRNISESSEEMTEKEEKPDFEEANDRFDTLDSETGTQKGRELFTSNTVPDSFNPFLQNTNQYIDVEQKSCVIVSQTCPGRGDNGSCDNASSVNGQERGLMDERDTEETGPAAEDFTFSEGRQADRPSTDCNIWQDPDVCVFGEGSFEDFITPNVMVKPAERMCSTPTSLTTSEDRDTFQDSDSDAFRRQDSFAKSECSAGRVKEATATVPTIIIAADNKEHSSTTTDFTTLPQSPILTRASYQSSSGPTTSLDTCTTFDAQAPQRTNLCSKTEELDNEKESLYSAAAVPDQEMLPDSQSDDRQSNMSYLLNKWHAMEEAPCSSFSPRSVSPTTSSQDQEWVSGLKSSRYLSTSTPNLSSAPSVYNKKLILTTTGSVTSEEDLDSEQDSSSISKKIMSRESNAVIYGSTGDLPASGRPLPNSRTNQSVTTTPKRDRYLMSSVDDLNIVLITSGDDTVSRDDLSGVSRDKRSPPLSAKVTSFQSSSRQRDPSQGSVEARDTVAGLPSVLSLIAKFDHHGHDPSTASSSSSFASSRKRWSSAPRLHGAESSPSTSPSSSHFSSSASLSDKKRRSSVHYRWDRSTSSWVLSSSSPGCRRSVSSRCAQVTATTQSSSYVALTPSLSTVPQSETVSSTPAPSLSVATSASVLSASVSVAPVPNTTRCSRTPVSPSSVPKRKHVGHSVALLRSVGVSRSKVAP